MGQNVFDAHFKSRVESGLGLLFSFQFWRLIYVLSLLLDIFCSMLGHDVSDQ